MATESEEFDVSPTRSLPFPVQVALAIAIVLLTSLTAIIFLTSNSRANEFIEDVLGQIDERIRVHDERVICILLIPSEERTPEAIAACGP